MRQHDAERRNAIDWEKVGRGTYCDAIEAPFQRLGTQALPLDVPSQGNYPFRSDVDVGISLYYSCQPRRYLCNICSRAIDVQQYLDGVEHLDDARVSQSAELLQRVLG